VQETVQRITLSVNEVATLIGVSTTTMYTLVREGQVPFKKVRSRILFNRGQIEAWLCGEPADQKQA
jgi:excisionase family DNA binding protein